MGGIIKITIKENKIVNSFEIHTSLLSSKYGSLENIFYKIQQDEFLEDSIDGEYSDLSLSDYGHIFIDRDSKKIFNLNDFSRISNLSLMKAINNNNDLKSLNYVTTVSSGEFPNIVETVSDARYNITELPYFYVLQGCLNVSDNVSYCGIKDGKTDVLFKTNLRDAFEVSKEFEEKTSIYITKYSHIYMSFENNEWDIKEGVPTSLDHRELFELFLKNNLL